MGVRRYIISQAGSATLSETGYTRDLSNSVVHISLSLLACSVNHHFQNYQRSTNLDVARCMQRCMVCKRKKSLEKVNMHTRKAQTALEVYRAWSTSGRNTSIPRQTYCSRMGKRRGHPALLPLLVLACIILLCQLMLAVLHENSADAIFQLGLPPIFSQERQRAEHVAIIADIEPLHLDSRGTDNSSRGVRAVNQDRGRLTHTLRGNLSVLFDKEHGSNSRDGVARISSLSETEKEYVKRPRQTADSSSTTQYLLPVLIGNQGFNNQFQSIKMISIVAFKRNLTLVAAPFFDHGYHIESQLPRKFEETLDVDILRKFVPVISLAEFKQKCKSRVTAVFLGTNMVRNQTAESTERVNGHVERSLLVYSNWTGVRFPRVFANLNRSSVVIQISDDLPFGVPVDNFLDQYPDSLTTSQRCTSFLYPYGYLGRLRYATNIDRYTHFFIRAKPVRTVARRFAADVMGNSSYICIHWRFNVEWKSAWCHQDYVFDLCEALDAMAPQGLARNLSLFMQTNNLKAAYFATELGEDEPLLKGLRAGIPNFFTSADLVPFTRQLKLQGDNYMTSLVEQELCKESTIFLASAFSSWSDMVKEDRHQKSCRNVANFL